MPPTPNRLALVVVANPATNSFGRAMADVARQVLAQRGYDVAFHDLYAEQFDPVQPTGEVLNLVNTGLVDAVIEQHCVELTRTDIDLGQFDLVTSFRFFGNAQHDLRLAVMKTLHRVLRSGGHLIINSHRNPHSLATSSHAATGGSFGGMDLHYFKLKSLLRGCGFAVVQLYPIGAWMCRYSI